MTNHKRPPGERGQGRKPLPEDQRTTTGSVRLTAAQWEKFRALGGNAWLREKIDRAKVKA